MAFMKISDSKSELEVVIFPTQFAQVKDILIKDNVIVIWGKIDKREDQLSMVTDKIAKFDPLNMEGMEKEVEITLPANSTPDVLQKINKTLREYPGRDKVAILLPNGINNIKKMSLPFGVKSDHILLESIEGILGKGAVRLT
jgi:DNA polymerase III subunit alpha